MTQTLDVQAPKAPDTPRAKGAAGFHGLPHGVMGGKTGAETARNGSSFLAIVERMIAGARDGTADGATPSGRAIAGRGAGDAKAIPGEWHTLNNKETVKDGKKAALARGRAGSESTGRIGHFAGGADTGRAESDGKLFERLGAGVPQERKSGALPSWADSPSAEEEKSLSLAESWKGSKRGGAGKLAQAGADGQNQPIAFVVLQNARGNQAALASEGPAERGNDRLEGVKGGKSSKQDKKALISVRDERTADPSQTVAGDSPFSKTVKMNADGNAEMTLSLRGIDGKTGTLAGEENRAAERREGEGKNFASMLSQELRNNASDFVKTGAIVLRDNNAGTIRLTLHPESLGSVQIKLELSGERRISGKIVVSSEEAYEAFNESLSGLQDAFVEGGFESAGFDLAFAGQGGGESGGSNASGAKSSPFYASAIPDVMSGAERVDSKRDGYRDTGSFAINVFA